MKVGDLVTFRTMIDQVIWNNAVCLVVSIEEYTPFDPDYIGYSTMVNVYIPNEERLHDFPIECLEVASESQ